MILVMGTEFTSNQGHRHDTVLGMFTIEKELVARCEQFLGSSDFRNVKFYEVHVNTGKSKQLRTMEEVRVVLDGEKK